MDVGPKYCREGRDKGKGFYREGGMGRGSDERKGLR
jgi:hypothetical protein